MKFATLPRQNLSLDTELLVRFALKRLSESNELKQVEPPQVVMALALAAVSNDKEFHDRLKENVTSSSERADEILDMSHKLFIPALWGLPNDQGAEENLFRDEEDCKQVLHYALGEGTRILAEKDFEFLRVFEFLTRTGLLCYSFRLFQFEAIRETFRDDPGQLLRRGAEIIEDALGIPRSEN